MSDPYAVPDDAQDFMKNNGRTFMITKRKDGSPTAHPMASWYGGFLYLNMYKASIKSKNLDRDPRICCVVTNRSDDVDLEAAVYRATGRKLTVDEVFAERVTDGLAWARNPRSEGSQEQPDIPDEDKRKIGDTAGRIKRGVRVIWELTANKAGLIQNVREG